MSEERRRRKGALCSGMASPGGIDERKDLMERGNQLYGHRSCSCQIPSIPSFLIFSLDQNPICAEIPLPFQAWMKQCTTGEGPSRTNLPAQLSPVCLLVKVFPTESYCLLSSELCALALFFPSLL